MVRKYGAVPVFLAFLAMGFGDVVGPLVGLAKVQFNLSNFMAQLIPLFGFIMFGLLSVPMGVFQDKHGKKLVLILGLCVMLVGLLIPVVGGLSSFRVLLVAILLLGAGATTLQVAGNPIMRDVSAEGKYSRNLSLAQFVKAIGSLAGTLIPVIALRSFGVNWNVIFPIYSVVVFVTVFAVLPLRTVEQNSAEKNPTSFRSSLALLKNAYVAMMVLAIFLYVGAEQCMSSGIPLYLRDRFGIDINRLGLLGTMLFFLSLTIGRFSGGVILNWLKPQKFLVITTVLSIVGLLGMFLPSRWIAVASFFLIGLGFANVFPLIFSITVDRRPQDTKALSGQMVTAIVGGAILPPLMGLVADRYTTQIGFLVPLTAVGYIMWTAAMNSRGSERSSAQAAS